MTALCLCVVRKMSSTSPSRACPRLSASIASVPVVVSIRLHVFRQFHRLHSEWGEKTSATAINAVPVLEDVYAGTTQEWSLRHTVPQQGETRPGSDTQ